MVYTLSLHYATKTAFFLITMLIPFILSSQKKKKFIPLIQWKHDPEQLPFPPKLHSLLS